MEKYLRLLNPKTTNFDAIGGGNFGALTREDVLLAISYARLSTAQDTLIKCLMGHFTIEEIERVSCTLISAYTLRDPEISINDHKGILAFKVAMLELFACSSNYKPTYRNRADLAGKSHMYVKRSLDHLIDDLKSQLKKDLEQAVKRISNQIRS